jgi:hypothetical protein
VIRRVYHVDLAALAAWACVVVGAMLTLIGADEIGAALPGESVEAARALVLAGVMVCLAGGVGCVVLARGAR